MRAKQIRSPSSKISFFFHGKSDLDVPILTLGWQWRLAHKKILSDIFDNSVGGTADAGLLDDNNYVDSNINRNAEAKSNLDENMTGKDNDDFCKKDPKTNIEELF